MTKGFIGWAALIAIAVVLVLSVGGGVYWLAHKQQNAIPVSNSEPDNQVPAKDESNTSSDIRFYRDTGTTVDVPGYVNIERTNGTTTLDITGWTIQSKQTGHSYTVAQVYKTWSDSSPVYTLDTPEDVQLRSGEDTVVHVMIGGDPRYNAKVKKNVIIYSLNTGAPDSFDPVHDTLTLTDTKGSVVATLAYPDKSSGAPESTQLGEVSVVVPPGWAVAPSSVGAHTYEITSPDYKQGARTVGASEILGGTLVAIDAGQALGSSWTPESYLATQKCADPNQTCKEANTLFGGDPGLAVYASMSQSGTLPTVYTTSYTVIHNGKVYGVTAEYVDQSQSVVVDTIIASLRF